MSNRDVQKIMDRVNYPCERCGKNIARFNGEDVICLNCGYIPYVKKSKIVENIKEAILGMKMSSQKDDLIDIIRDLEGGA